MSKLIPRQYDQKGTVISSYLLVIETGSGSREKDVHPEHIIII